jgi:hypothetical protein
VSHQRSVIIFAISIDYIGKLYWLWEGLYNRINQQRLSLKAILEVGYHTCRCS